MPQGIKSAVDDRAAIDLIVTQEGTNISTYFPEGDNDPANNKLAHYYRFAQLVWGRLKPNPSPPPKPKPEDLYFYDANDRVPFDAATVLPVRSNLRASDFQAASDTRKAMDQFNQVYTRMLSSLG